MNTYHNCLLRDNVNNIKKISVKAAEDENCFDKVLVEFIDSEYEKYYPYLRLYLNSNVATYIYKKISVPKANGYSIYKNAFLKEMPIVFPDKQAGLSEFENMSQDDFNRYLYQKLELTESEIQTVIDSINELRGV